MQNKNFDYKIEVLSNDEKLGFLRMPLMKCRVSIKKNSSSLRELNQNNKIKVERTENFKMFYMRLIFYMSKKREIII